MLYLAVVDIYSQKIFTLELYGSDQVVLKHSIRTEVSCSQSDLLTSVLVIDNIINLRKFRILALSIIVPQGTHLFPVTVLTSIANRRLAIFPLQLNVSPGTSLTSSSRLFCDKMFTSTPDIFSALFSSTSRLMNPVGQLSITKTTSKINNRRGSLFC